jgi:AcrR family transcriptional regulator
MAYVTSHGVGDLSLRELAADIGTSHRMLIYHFGSKEGLLVAIVQRVEAAMREVLAALASDESLSLIEVGRRLWRRVSDPRLEETLRLFFELYAQALQGRPGTTGLLDDIVDSWVRPLAKIAEDRGVPPDIAEADARLGVAVSRGLLLDLVATGERAAVERAFERYVSIYDSASKAMMRRRPTRG